MRVIPTTPPILAVVRCTFGRLLASVPISSDSRMGFASVSRGQSQMNNRMDRSARPRRSFDSLSPSRTRSCVALSGPNHNLGDVTVTPIQPRLKVVLRVHRIIVGWRRLLKHHRLVASQRFPRCRRPSLGFPSGDRLKCVVTDRAQRPHAAMVIVSQSSRANTRPDNNAMNTERRNQVFRHGYSFSRRRVIADVTWTNRLLPT